MSAPSPQPRLLERLGLARPELAAWAMYDWANSAMVTIVITAVFPIYFQTVAAADLEPATATARYNFATAVALGLVALLSPVLGAIADIRARRKLFLGGFAALGALGTMGLFSIEGGEWPMALVLFGLANLGAGASQTFYDGLLPYVAQKHEVDRVSTAGYALGYLGGGLALAAGLALAIFPAFFGIDIEVDPTLPARLCFLGAGLWWIAFTLPLLWFVVEPPAELESDEQRGQPVMRNAFRRLFETLRELHGYRDAFLMLVAFLIYNDGILTIVRMAALFGTDLELPTRDLVLAILLVQFVGIPFAFAFGALADRIGVKRAVLLGVGLYFCICIYALCVHTAVQFYLLALMVAVTQGGTQALSRSCFSRLVPKHKSSEFFGFFAMGEKFAGILGPVLFGSVVAATGSLRLGVGSVAIFFLVGGLLLWRVDLAAGEARARAAEPHS